MGKQWKQWQTLFWGAPKSLQMVTEAMKLKDTCSLKVKLWPTYILKSRDITLPAKVCLVKTMVFPVVMYGCESWTIKKAEHQRTDAFELVLEKTLASPLDCKEIKPINPKGNQSWIFIGRTDAESETPIRWPPDAKTWLIWKDPDAGRLKAGGEGDNREWDGWMASPTQWKWVWVNYRSWWWTGRPGVLQPTGSQRVGQTEQLNWTELIVFLFLVFWETSCFQSSCTNLHAHL